MTIARTICLGFFTVIAVGTLLLMMPFATSAGTWNDPIVALFTSTSAVCVTGLIVVDTGSYFSFWGQLIILLLIQVGGLGYMTTTTFLILLLGRRFNLRQKFAIQESLDRPSLQGSQNLVRSIIATHLVFEFTGILFLIRLFSEDYSFHRSLWLATFHSVSAWNNAGFSLFEDSLIGYRSSLIVNLVVCGLIIFGGLGYEAIIEIYFRLVKLLKRNRSKFVYSLNFKVVTSTSLSLLFLGTVAFFVIEFTNSQAWSSLSLSEKILAAWFQSVVTRTAGFNTVEIGQMTTAALFIAIGLMFIGASPSGTGGGIKTTTLRILVNCTRSILQNKKEVVLYGRSLPTTVMLKAVGVVFGSATAIVTAIILISLSDSGFPFIQLLFEVTSAFATVGLSTGITMSLSSWGKLVLILTMYVGRVGILIFIGAILGDSPPSVIKHPKEDLLVG